MAVQAKKVFKMKSDLRKNLDFDPEDEPTSQPEGSSDSDEDLESDNDEQSRAHYQHVSTSKLRKPEKIELDSEKYGGKPVSRATLDGDQDFDLLAPEEESEEDPFAQRDGEEGSGDDASEAREFEDLPNGQDEDDEIDSDEAFEDGDDEVFRRKGFVFRGSKSSETQPPDGRHRDGERQESKSSDDAESNSAYDEDDEAAFSIESGSGVEDNKESISDSGSDEGSDENEDEDEDEDTSMDEDEEGMKANPLSAIPSSTIDRKSLRSVMSSNEATVSASLSQALATDAAKGKAVKIQYQTFDRLLDARIKLQKGLTASNTFDHSSEVSAEEVQTAMEKAEEAALRLFSTLESIRENILHLNMDDPLESTADKRKDKKRKRAEPATKSTTNKELQQRINGLETKSLQSRRSTIDKWSLKTRASAPPLSTSKLNLQSDQDTSKITAIIDTYLVTTSDKLIAESTTNTDTTTANNNNNSSQPELHNQYQYQYQDTIFYQSLLREMITTRTHLNSSSTSSSSTPLPSKLHPSGSTSASLRGKKIDTKASKGRKVRYTVHEKLENFMAGTGVTDTGDSGQWTDAAVREFFGSLMGNRNRLVEEYEENMDQEGGDQVSGEMEALKLFRS